MSRRTVILLSFLLLLFSFAGGATAAYAFSTGWHTASNCPPPGFASTGSADACDIMPSLGDSHHGIDIYTGRTSTKALCMWDYLHQPGVCLATLGAAVQTFGRTIPLNNDGDSLDSYGNSNVFIPTNRILANGGIITSGNVEICPPSHLVDEQGCVILTLTDLQWLVNYAHSQGG